MRKKGKLWMCNALEAAKGYYNNCFRSKRGIFGYDTDPRLIGIHNSNPYAGYPLLRDEEIAELRRRMAAAGFQEFACVSYPLSGLSKGHTITLIAETPEGWIFKQAYFWLVDQNNELLDLSRKRMKEIDEQRKARGDPPAFE
jgi:hypothetical protein